MAGVFGVVVFLCMLAVGRLETEGVPCVEKLRAGLNFGLSTLADLIMSETRINNTILPEEEYKPNASYLYDKVRSLAALNETKHTLLLASSGEESALIDTLNAVVDDTCKWLESAFTNFSCNEDELKRLIVNLETYSLLVQTQTLFYDAFPPTQPRLTEFGWLECHTSCDNQNDRIVRNTLAGLSGGTYICLSCSSTDLPDFCSDLPDYCS